MQCIPKFLTKRYTGDCYQYPLGNPEREELEGEREREREREREGRRSHHRQRMQDMKKEISKNDGIDKS
jgi:hypothetical protein